SSIAANQVLARLRPASKPGIAGAEAANPVVSMATRNVAIPHASTSSVGIHVLSTPRNPSCTARASRMPSAHPAATAPSSTVIARIASPNRLTGYSCQTAWVGSSSMVGAVAWSVMAPAAQQSRQIRPGHVGGSWVRGGLLRFLVHGDVEAHVPVVGDVRDGHGHAVDLGHVFCGQLALDGGTDLRRQVLRAADVGALPDLCLQLVL